MPRENKSKYAILGILCAAPMSGYDIKKKIESSANYFWHESYGQIYPILKRLVQEELATKSTEEQVGKPDRYVYTLTDKGRRELQEWLKEPVESQVERIEILLKLFFGRHMPMADNVRHVQEFREFQAQLHERLQLLTDEVSECNTSENRPYWVATVSYGLHVSQALIDWCDETLESFKPVMPDRSPK